MLRITERRENGTTVRLRLDGNLSETGYPELESICIRYRESDDIVLLLDLAGVDFVQNAVAKKLARLRGERLRLINCSPYVEMLLESVAE